MDFSTLSMSRIQLKVIEVLPEGYNSLVNLVLCDGFRRVMKIFGTKKKPITLAEAQELVSDIRNYHSLLVECGVRVPEIGEFGIGPHPEFSGYCVIFQLLPYVGHNVENLLRKADPEEVASCVRRMLETVHVPLLGRRDKLGHLVVGIDSKPDNFTVSDDGQMYFVDFMPPRYRKGNFPIVEYPYPQTEEGQKLCYFRHFVPEGIFKIFYQQLCRLRPDFRRVFFDTISDFAACEGLTQVTQAFQESISFLFSKFSPLQQAALIDRTNSPYDLREIAVELSGQSKDEFLETVYRLTHFEDGLPVKVLEEVKLLLKERLY